MNTALKKSLIALAAGSALVAAAPAEASDTVFGAVVGAGVGALIGHAVGGHDGAIVGGAFGALAGASSGLHARPVRVHGPVAVVPAPVVPAYGYAVRPYRPGYAAPAYVAPAQAVIVVPAPAPRPYHRWHGHHPRVRHVHPGFYRY